MNQTARIARYRAASLRDTAPSDPRLRYVLRVEWTLLAVRYAALCVLLGFHSAGIAPGYFPNLLVTLAGVLGQNLFVHWVMHTSRHALFLSRLNFTIHLTAVALIVGLTGTATSPLAVLYPMFIVGCCIYSAHFLGMYRVTLICCAAYGATALLKWHFSGGEFLLVPVMLDFLGILICGWLVGTLAQLLRKSELLAREQAQALVSSEATVRTILDSTAEPILVYGENEFISDVNERACEYLGLERSELVGQRFRRFIFDDGTLDNKLASLRARGEYHGEFVLTTDGDDRNVDVLARSFVRDGKRYFVVMMHDITGQKHLNEASRLATLRLEEINRELQQMNQIRTAFHATVSHRLRSPLSAVLGYCDLLLNDELGELTPDQRKAVQGCRESVMRVLGMLDEAARVESTPLEETLGAGTPAPVGPSAEKS